MFYQAKIAPVPSLAADVNCFWALEQDQESYNEQFFAPDSFAEVVINLAAPLSLETERGLLELPRAFVNPIQNSVLQFRVAGFCQMISMKLYPWALKPILNIDAAPSSVHVIGLDARWQRFAKDLAQVVAQRGYEEAIDCYQDFVCKMAYQQTHDVMPIRMAGHLLRLSQGQIRMTELAAQSHLSSSQFERQFKRYTAVSPKTYARIVRFESVRAALMLNPASRLATLANEHGYSDQAHLIREFKAFAFCTPRDFATLVLGYSGRQVIDDWHKFEKQSLEAALLAC